MPTDEHINIEESIKSAYRVLSYLHLMSCNTDERRKQINESINELNECIKNLKTRLNLPKDE